MDKPSVEVFVGLEEAGWRELGGIDGPAYYWEHMAGDGLMVVPGAVLTKEQAIEAMAAAPPWSWFRITQPRLLRLGADAVVVVYEARAQRDGQPEYRALVSSTYTRGNDAWELAVHQLTPLTDAPGEIGCDSSMAAD
jgi:hypothetical protein